MPKGLSADIFPRMKTLKDGELLRNKIELTGTNAFGVHEDDEDLIYGSEPVIIPKGTICMFAEDIQFYGTDKTTPMSAWVRWRLIAGDKVIYYTLVCERKRIWDFETYRGRQRIITSAIEKTFEVLAPAAVKESRTATKDA